jgi:hypothetical protein
VRGGDQLFRARGAAGVVGGALREADLERADLAAAELDLTGAVLKAAVPGGTGGASGHVLTSMSVTCRAEPGTFFCPVLPAPAVDERETTSIGQVRRGFRAHPSEVDGPVGAAP